MGARSPPKTVEQALKDCHIEAKEYFLATLASNGVVKYFISSPNQRDIRAIFNEPQFRHVLSADGSANSIEPSGFHENAQVMGGHSYNSRSPGTTNPQQARPRARPSAKRIPLMIGNSNAVYQFYIDQFNRIQQTACKLIAKAWIKTVAPKKQSTHPYTGQAIPDWWPKRWGETPFDAVRQKETDHLKKYGANTHVFIMPPDVMEDEDDGEEERTASPASNPAEGNLSILIHSHSPQTTTVSGPTSIMPLPSPSPHYSPGALTSDIMEQSPYMENSTGMDIDENLQGQHGRSRRTSAYSCPTFEYAKQLVPLDHGRTDLATDKKCSSKQLRLRLQP
ncbi:Protein of unknown function (DUF2841) domain containing protein [Rhypophila sp. PSN 637]